MAPLPALDKLDPQKEWAAWKPGKEAPFTAQHAAHLWRRAGFGPSFVELRESVEKGLEKTLDRFFDPPKGTTDAPVNPADIGVVRAWWLKRMLNGPDPLREKMTFFWHDHFATSNAKIQSAELMLQQNELLRKHALGNFGAFLREMSRDPAMLIWLDSNQNLKAHPNENYAREVMELFSLGVGNYTEKDIREAARAFTGWHTVGDNPARRRFEFNAREHDDGSKTFLGQTGKWDGEDIIRILLEQKACATFLVRKLYRFLVSETHTPPDAFLQPVAEVLRKNDYDLFAAVRMILSSRHFFSAYALRQRVQSPVEYAVGVSRLFGVGVTGRIVLSPYSLLSPLEAMGQMLFAPPNVKGWEGGRSWLSTATVLARHNFVWSLLRSPEDLNTAAAKLSGNTFLPAIDPLCLFRRTELTDPAEILGWMERHLQPEGIRPEARAKLLAHLEKGEREGDAFEGRCRDVLYTLLTMGESQLG